MRIAVDCRMIGSGGIGSFISGLLPYFLEENECLLIGRHEQCSPFLRMPNASFCFCGIRPFSVKEIFFFPEDVLEEINQRDVYFTPYCDIPGGIRIPVFSTIHDVVFLDVRGLTGFLGRFARKLFYGRAAGCSDGIFTVSNFSKERILRHLRCKKPPEVVHNSAPAYLREPFDNPPRKKDQILFVGNIKRHKGLGTLLEAFQAASQKNGSFKSSLVIVGNAENFRTGDDEISGRLRELSSERDDIVFTGKISDEELRVLYASSKVLVQPSLYEGFGMPPLEAMTVGTRAIISDIPVFKEIYSDFPVTFFRAGDADDLSEKLLSFEDSPLSDDELSLIRGKYSYKKSAQKIVEVMGGKL